jgi:hypothetical protein
MAITSKKVHYNNLLKSNAENADVLAELQKSTATDLEMNVLDQLVAAVLVHEGAEQETGDGLAALVEGKISQFSNDAKIRQGVLMLYGMQYEDFREEVLVPQTERDILAGQLFLKGESAEDWILGARRSAKVSIFSGAFRWDGEKVIANSK